MRTTPPDTFPVGEGGEINKRGKGGGMRGELKEFVSLIITKAFSNVVFFFQFFFHRCKDFHQSIFPSLCFFRFLNASSHLYKRVCASVRMTVRMSYVRMSYVTFRICKKSSSDQIKNLKQGKTRFSLYL